MIRLGLQAFVTTFVSSSTRHRAPALTQLPVHNFNSWLNMGKSAKKFYAVHRGKNGFQGVLNDWPTCQRQVNGVTGAVFKSFQTRAEAVAFAENGWSSLRESRKRDASSSRGESSEKVERPTAAGTPLGGKEGSDDTDPMTLVVYTDGACTGNGKAIAKAGVGVYFGDGDELNYSAKLDGELQTNQRAEMVAVLKAMTLSLEHGRVKAGFTLRIWTDSVYTLKGITTWIHGWKKKKWKVSSGAPVKNQDLWVALDEARDALTAAGVKLDVVWIKGHAGHRGNEMADRLACAGVSA